MINGGREFSTYPDRCVLNMERRTIEGESDKCGFAEAETILKHLRAEDAEFTATAKPLFSRPPYLTAASVAQELGKLISTGLARRGVSAVTGGMSFWTDAAILGASGIPSIVFGPGGAGLHSTLEYVLADDVITCRDALIELALEFCI